jgi:hypothetical protein
VETRTIAIQSVKWIRAALLGAIVTILMLLTMLVSNIPNEANTLFSNQPASTSVAMTITTIHQQANANPLRAATSQQVAPGCSYPDYLSFYYAAYYSGWMETDSREFFYDQRDWFSRCGW